MGILIFATIFGVFSIVAALFSTPRSKYNVTVWNVLLPLMPAIGEFSFYFIAYNEKNVSPPFMQATAALTFVFAFIHLYDRQDYFSGMPRGARQKYVDGINTKIMMASVGALWVGQIVLMFYIKTIMDNMYVRAVFILSWAVLGYLIWLTVQIALNVVWKAEKIQKELDDEAAAAQGGNP